jgi:peptide/nickel transport system substrate-binding protein
MGRFATLLLFAAVAVVSCSPTVDSTTTTSVGAIPSTIAGPTSTVLSPQAANEVIIGVGQPILTLNPFADAPSGGTNLAGQAVWATIYDVVPETWQRVPETVTSLPSQTAGAISVADDGSMTVRYEVQQGATWSDGTPITGADIAFTAQAMAQLALAGEPAVEPIMATVVATDSVERLAWITFSQASLAFEDALWVILPSHAIEGATTELKNLYGFDWPSGGPFQVAEMQSPGALSLEPNAFYWKTDDRGGQLPLLESLTFITAAEPGLEVDLFTSHSADVIVVPPDPEAIDALPTGTQLQQVATPILEHLTFQFGDGRDAVNPMSNNDLVNFRRAIAHALDRPTLLAETGVPWMDTTPGVLLPTGQSEWNRYAYDPGQGASLIDALIGDDELDASPEAVLSTTGNGDYRVRIGDALVGSFDGIGVDLETSYLDSLIFFGEQLGTGEFDIGMWAWVSDGGYTSQLGMMELFDPLSETVDSDYGNWGSAESLSEGAIEFSELAAEAGTTVDPVRFDEIVVRAEELLADDLPLVPLFQRSSTAAIWPDEIDGVVHNGSKSGLTWNVEWWQKLGG